LEPSIQSNSLSVYSFDAIGVNCHWMPLPSYETLSDLTQPTLSELENSHLTRRTSLKRKTEFLSIRYLKNHRFSGLDIAYENSGKPFFKDSKWHIGISHSNERALWCYALIPFGCDIESFDTRLLKVGSRFCNENEVLVASMGSPLKTLTCLWSCKEAIYKLVNQPGLDWKRDMWCETRAEQGLIFAVNLGAEITKIHCAIFPDETHLIAIATYA